jgi:DNA primase
VELMVAELPTGRDPADLLEQEGAEALTGRLERAIPALEFEVRRVLSDEDLGTPAGVDRALDRLRPLVVAAPQNSEERDHLIRLVQDRVSLSKDRVRSRLTASAGAAPAAQAAPAAVPSPERLAPKVERAFLSMCFAGGETGRRYLEALTDAHLGSPVARRARDHLREHFDDPLGALPADDPDAAALVTRAVMAAQQAEETGEDSLRLSFLQLELRRVESDLSGAKQAGDRERQSELARAKQALRLEMAGGIE